MTARLQINLESENHELIKQIQNWIPEVIDLLSDNFLGRESNGEVILMNNTAEINGSLCGMHDRKFPAHRVIARP